ncbi:MAG: GNAT family N-acetyltransferase [Fretibacterium sp.]|nr:GNAT family N-acetyltransferase [Fretibacterium sp.]
MNAELWDNLGFFLTRLRGLPSCESLTLPGGFCLSTGSGSASENWAFLPGIVPDGALVEAVLRFFGERGLPFIWPVEAPLENQAKGTEALAMAGLHDAGRLVVMCRGVDGLPEGNLSVALRPVLTPEDALGWAEAAWRGFDGDAPAPGPFRALADAMRGDAPALYLASARIGDEDVGTCLLALPPFPGAGGVYYFATVPEHRRRGVAAAMMAEAARLARSRGLKRIILQSTPSGLPFYRSAGFESLGGLALFSTSPDVF